jgi:hypothetical protein
MGGQQLSAASKMKRRTEKLQISPKGQIVRAFALICW